MKSFLNIRLLIVSLTILGSGYLFYSAANCSSQAQDKLRPLMPSVISPFGQANLVAVGTAEVEPEVDVAENEIITRTLKNLIQSSARAAF